MTLRRIAALLTVSVLLISCWGTRRAEDKLLVNARDGNFVLVKTVIVEGFVASINSRDAQQNTPLMLATANGHQAIVELLLVKGADFRQKNLEGRTALMIANAGGRRLIAQLLSNAGAQE
jgi:ankyrin repeat protein